MQLVKSETPLTPGKRDKGPNPFMEEKTLELFKSGETFTITIDPAKGEKPHAIVSSARDAAKSVGLTVATSPSGKNLTKATSFRIAFVKPRAPRQPKNAEGSAPATNAQGGASTTGAKAAAKRK